MKRRFDMRDLQAHIASKQAEFAAHPFFDELDGWSVVDELAPVASALTFWVMAFQDLLRLNEREASDPQLSDIVRHHRLEDHGHQRWFLEDLAVMDAAPTIDDVFGDSHAATRDATYALMAEVFRVEDDRLRVALLLTLESAGHVFFGRIAPKVEQIGLGARLRYFSSFHLDVEKNHEVFGSDLEDRIAAIELGPALRDRAVGLVDRCYAAFTAMFDGACRHHAGVRTLVLTDHSA